MSTPGAVPAQRVRPRKSLGQHWLVDTRAIRRIAEACGVGPGDTVVEIGPGTGRLTSALAETGARVIAVEIDDDLIGSLRERFADAGVTILNADILQVPAVELLAGTGREAAYTVTGNLPYYIGTAVIRHFLYSDRPPAAMVVMLQEEVAQGVVAGTGHRNYLSVMVQAIADARILFSLPPSAFRPAPRVRSAVVRLETRKEPLVARERIADFLEFAQAGFRAPRKTLRNSLVVGLQAEAAAVDDLLGRTGVDSKQRPAFVELEEWVRLFEAWSSGR